MSEIRKTRLARLIMAMALDRKSFKDKIFNLCDGALEHFFCVKLAQLNSQKEWVQHWSTEVARMVGPDVRRILRKETKGRWDKKKAVQEALEEVKLLSEVRLKREADAYIQDVYALPRVNLNLPLDVSKEFYEMVLKTVDAWRG